MLARIVPLLVPGPLALPGIACALDGANLFDNRRSLCHQDPPPFKGLDREYIVSVLQDGKIDEHRFAPSTEEIDALVSFLTGQQ